MRSNGFHRSPGCTSGVPLRSNLPFLVNTSPTHQQKGASQNCAPRTVLSLIWSRTPIARPTPCIESLESLLLLGLGRSRFGTEGGGIVATLYRLRIAQLPGCVSGFGGVFAAKESCHAP